MIGIKDLTEFADSLPDDAAELTIRNAIETIEMLRSELERLQELASDVDYEIIATALRDSK